jgi:hypothetical protein
MLGVLAWLLAAKRPPPFFKKPVRPTCSAHAHRPACSPLTRCALAATAQYNPVLGETHFAVGRTAWLLVEQARRMRCAHASRSSVQQRASR